MKPNKNIDRLFQEKLRDFEEMPPDIVWENIEAHLDGKKKRRVIPLWWRYAGVAVVLLLLTFSGIQYFKNTNNGTDIGNTIVDVDNSDDIPLIDSNSSPNNTANDNTIVSSSGDNDEHQLPSAINKEDVIENKSEIKQDNSNINESVVVVQNNTKNPSFKPEQAKTTMLNDENKAAIKNNLIAQTDVKEPSEERRLNVVNDDLSTKVALKNPLVKTTNTNTIVATTDLPSNTNESQLEKEDDKKSTDEVVYENIENLEDTLDDKYKIPVVEKTDEISKRWSVATVVAPVFYNSFNTKGSPLDLQFENSPKEGSQSVSYGIKVGFKLNKKWSIQSGVTMMNVGYSVGDVYINPSPQFASRLTNVDYISTATILNVNATNIIDSNQIETSATDPIRGSLNQEYGYIEVPLEMKYSLTNGKLGVHLIGGFSTLFLNSNKVFVETPEFSSELGEARNLNNVDFSGNLGFDIDYSINKHLYINVSPMLKVYTNTFSENYENSDNFKPYLFGVYTGLNYRF